MARRSYQLQHLAAFAAGTINAAGTTTVTFGCSMTRISTGNYGLILPSDANLQDRQTWTFVSIKGTAPRFKNVVDTTNALKTIQTFDGTGSAADADIEVTLYREVTNNLG
jgi:hypothetical protein